jgi:DNA-binding ferritin-like protein
MAEDVKRKWDEVGERFATLGRALAARYKQLEMESEEEREARDALRALTRTLDRAFTSLGDTLRDPHAKDELRAAARSLADALGATFEEVTEEVRKRVGRPAA